MVNKTELTMGFEKTVLDKVAEVLKQQGQAEFFCGSLSVICTAQQARQIATRLTKDFGAKVEMSRDASYGYIFDFVA
jgi:hypothetical protein